MVEVTNETNVAAPVEAVWAVLADFDRLASWAQEIDHSCQLSERSEGVGTERRVQVKSNVVLERVTVWQPEEKLAYEIVGLPNVVSRVVNEWTLTAEGDRTRLALTAQVEPGPKPPMKLVARLLAKQMGSVNQRLLRDLAVAATRAVEAAPPEATGNQRS
ncbi:MAG: SRPBCC family protein [Acidimicrobiaceae bacterium]|nr:SRPBCC family protein [Acidimicrobiaceae bacterium]MYD05573.1 SRPBCC family protein [Acidimicrobiaceae bacterium]MYI57599.1 SRPBCC family protein [Acidimicrobiaceae bacterium]